MPYVKWMLGAEDLTPEDDMPIGRNVLELTDVRQSNNYTCVAMSTLGVIEAVAQIIVKGGLVRMYMWGGADGFGVRLVMVLTNRAVFFKGCKTTVAPVCEIYTHTHDV